MSAPSRRPGRVAAAAVFALLVAPPALEGVWRCGYALQLGEPDWLTDPGPTTPLGQRHGASVAAGDPSGAPVVLPPPGPFRFTVEDNVVTRLTIHAPGFRGRSLDTPTPRRPRVAAEGGSSTFSPECGEGESWPERLEAKLARSVGPPAVFNAGAFGASSAEVLWLTETHVLPKDVDVLLVTTAFNDVPSSHVTVDLRPLVAPWHRRWLWGRSLFYTAVAQTLLAARRASGADWVAQQEAYADHLERLASTARAHGAQPVFIAQPILGADQIRVGQSALGRRGSGTTARRVVAQLGDRIAQQRVLVERMQREAARLEVPFVDVRADFLATAHPQALFELFLHLTPVGADRFAHLLTPHVEAHLLSSTP